MNETSQELKTNSKGIWGHLLRNKPNDIEKIDPQDYGYEAIFKKLKTYTPQSVRDIYLSYLAADEKLDLLTRFRMKRVPFSYMELEDSLAEFDPESQRIYLNDGLVFNKLNDVHTVMHEVEHSYVHFLQKKLGNDISGLETDSKITIINPDNQEFEITTVEDCLCKYTCSEQDELGFSPLGRFLDEAITEFTSLRGFAHFLRSEFNKDTKVIATKLRHLETPPELLPSGKIVGFNGHKLKFTNSKYMLNLHCTQMLSIVTGISFDEMIDLHRHTPNGFTRDRKSTRLNSSH